MSETEDKVTFKHAKSIHPRVVGGRTAFAKVNTSKKKNPDTILRAINGIQKHLEIHKFDDQSKMRLTKLTSLL